MKQFSLFIFVFCTHLLFCQNESNIWYFGRHAGVDFNSGSPEILLDGALDTNEGCATISDSNGDLLFYTDGVTVYDRSHNIMPNGTNLNGDFSSTQSAIAIPFPNNASKYLIFTVDSAWNNPETEGLQYSEIDMTLNNGFGDVTEIKNVLLEQIVNEKVTAVLNADEDGYWVLSHRHSSDEFIAYEVTASGVNMTPVVSAVGTETGVFNLGGQIKVSPNGEKVAVARGGGGVQIFDFDDSTGVISNPITIDVSVNTYGIEFSPNNTVLYVSFYGGIYQYNLISDNESDIVASEVTLIDAPGYGYTSIQLGPDQKIYVARTLDYYLGVINNPNIVGLGCNYDNEGLYLGGRQSTLGLPAFMQSFFNVGFQFSDNCAGYPIEFVPNISEAYDSLIWDFGDGNTSTEDNPTYTYANAGNYEVSLSVTLNSESYEDSKIISIYELPTVTPIVVLRQCDDDIDGFSSFNLNEANAEISVNYLEETITYYESELDAENANNPIANVMSYTNQTVSTDRVWARVENSNGCFDVAPIDLVVSTTQLPETFMKDFYQCDDGEDIVDGVSTFDFSSVTPEIEALFPVGQQLEINYYSTLSEALSETNAIENISQYQNIGSPNHQDIYVRVANGLNNDCLALGHHITLHVNPVPLITGPVILEQCDEGNDGEEYFDTSGIEAELLEGQTAPIVISYSDEFGNTYPSPLPNPMVSNVPILNIFATLSIEDETSPSGSCSVQTTISFGISSGVTAHPVSTLSVCDTDGDGLYAFDTSTIASTVLNGQEDVVLNFYEADGTLLPNPLPNPYTITSKSIVARVESTVSSFCFDETIIEFQVNAVPVAHAISNDFVCDDVSNDGEHVFTLSDYDNQILGGQSDTNFEVFYFDNLENAEQHINPLQNNFVVTAESVTVYAKIQNVNEAGCYDIVSFQLGVNYFPIVQQLQNISVCDDPINDGFTELDLTNFDAEILGDLNPSGFNVSYYLSLSDAIESHNQIAYDYTNTTNPQTIYARLENANSPQCFTTTSVEITIKEQPVLQMDEFWALCAGHSVEIIADFGYDYYNWSTGQTTRAIVVSEPGDYTVVVSNDYGDLRCSTEKTVSVSLSDVAVITAVETVDWSQSANVISVFVEGIGDYEYSLDGISYQDAPIFEALPIGDYDVYVRDKNGCGVIVEEVYLLNYPRYFTPNGDGTNEFWQIKNAINEPLNKVYIYDRYGKLITELKPNDSGWDGTLNGNRLPSSDYWFVLERQNGKTYTGHFALKR
ncbi:T9SS type B sorting domain-containing protein [Winogradskyella vidalii]|uniref:T9SS type B sorting domain-containing protein n=1 Tax=Winogradskyella vidalii TaxID=2615024 RepID=UPI0015CACCF8|nr:T9SS type B sorting domain-containing protein [Winogradskyella vidalii]